MSTLILTWLLAIPLLGSLVVLVIPRSWEEVIKKFSIAGGIQSLWLIERRGGQWLSTNQGAVRFVPFVRAQ